MQSWRPPPVIFTSPIQRCARPPVPWNSWTRSTSSKQPAPFNLVMSEHRLEVADVLRTHGDEFLARWGHVLSRPQRKAFDDIRACRTAALGGHLDQCDQCGHRAISYNSCLMGSNSLWGVEERLSARSKLFSFIQAVLDGRRLPITNRPFCGWDMPIAMR